MHSADVYLTKTSIYVAKLVFSINNCNHHDTERVFIIREGRSAVSWFSYNYVFAIYCTYTVQ